MSAPPEIISLTRRFGLNLQDYKSGQYNETQLRHEYLDPFFEVLGWDVNNKQGSAEAYKDVIHEDSIKVGGLTKAPDYCFRIGGTRKFFVEAKKPSVNIKDDINPTFQLRRYAWSARLPLSILTDFEEFAVYDCRVKPDKADKSATARTLFINFQEYEKRWDEIASIFSLEAIRKGSFDRYAESEKKKKGTAEVDAAFLKEIESWRELLARNIALRNPALSQRELNFAVQQTIDRIIFLRICEDRGIEEYNKLYSALNGVNVYQRLCQLFRRADEKYNSGLFHFTREKEREEPDELTLNLSIDDNPLKEIIKGLYYPDSPYEFSVLPADILGQVYEQFLGKVIRLTDGHRAVVEDKPEVKKAGGVYYTPTYIVDYIVKNTVGALLGNATPLSPPLPFGPELTAYGPRGELKGGPKSAIKQLTPKEASKLRILDPACGSGSFLIGAFQFLLDWHRDWYVSNDPQKWAKAKSPVLFQAHGGEWRLTTTEKRRILLNNIYGVDIDPQAVEVTKLSLLLKVLEGESEESLNAQLKMFHERALPDLGNNIKCGNSLIGPDFYNTSLDSPLAKGRNRGVEQQLFSFDDEERYRINVFDWEKEFPEIFNPSQSKSKRSLSPLMGEGRGEGGGFDAVIGNPPYVRQEGLGHFKKYFQIHYKTFQPTADLYVNFIEQGHKLLKPTGLYGMIVSNKWLRAAYGRPLREFLSSDVTILKVVDLAGLPVFANATVRTIILISTPRPKQSSFLHYLAPVPLEAFCTIHSGDDLQKIVDQRAIELPVMGLSAEGWSFSGRNVQRIIERIQQASLPLSKYIKGKPYFGIKTGLNEAFIIDQTTRDRLTKQDPKSAEIIRPLLAGKDVRRYAIEFKDRYLIWTHIGVPIDRYPAIFTHLKQFQPQLQKRCDKGNFWWELRACDYYDKFNKTKIIYPDIATSCRFALDRKGFFGSNTTYFIPVDDLYLLGILNSCLGQFYFSQVCAGLEGSGATYLRFFGQYLENIPIYNIDYSNLSDKARHDKIVSYVERMLALNKQLASSKTAHEKTNLQRQVDATDRQIDNLVYELYGLTEEEIRIVEGG